MTFLKSIFERVKGGLKSRDILYLFIFFRGGSIIKQLAPRSYSHHPDMDIAPTRYCMVVTAARREIALKFCRTTTRGRSNPLRMHSCTVRARYRGSFMHLAQSARTNTAQSHTPCTVSHSLHSLTLPAQSHTPCTVQIWSIRYTMTATDSAAIPSTTVDQRVRSSSPHSAANGGMSSAPTRYT